jgi:hypothetical protein
VFKIDPKYLKLYIDYQYERSAIYYKKEILKETRPWTNQNILNKYKFTNIRRELDKESRFLIKTVLSRSDININDKLLNAALFRCINSSNSIELFKYWPINFEHFNEEEFANYEKSQWLKNPKR